MVAKAQRAVRCSFLAFSLYLLCLLWADETFACSLVDVPAVVAASLGNLTYAIVTDTNSWIVDNEFDVSYLMSNQSSPEVKGGYISSTMCLASSNSDLDSNVFVQRQGTKYDTGIEKDDDVDGSGSGTPQWLTSRLARIKLERLGNLYGELLDKYPVRTKSLTAAVVSLFGDLLAQIIERGMMDVGKGRRLNFYRACTVSAEGLLVSGPILHYAYTWMDEAFTKDGASEGCEGSQGESWFSTLCQVMFDLIVMDSTLVATLMITSALLQGRWRDITSELRNGYLPAAKVSFQTSLVLAPIQFLNFRYVPVRSRVLVTNFEDVGWNAAVSYMAHKSRK